MNMFSEQKTLVELIKTATKKYEKEIEKLVQQNHSAFERYKANLELLEESTENITSIPLEELAEVIAESEVGEEEREREFGFLKSIRKLLELNQTKQTTYQLSERQKSYITLLTNQLKALEEKNQTVVTENEKTLEKIKTKLKELKHLLGILEDSKNKEMIDQLDILQELFDMTETPEEQRRAILYGILRYNQAIFHDKGEKKVIEKPRINIEELKELFTRHGYEFLDLKKELQEQLLTYGSYSTIEQLLEALERLKFPRFDCKRNGTKLVALLINSDPITLEETVEYAKTKGLTPRDLLLLVPALIEQNPNRKRKERNDSETLGESSPMIAGRSIDFKKNIELLEEHGFPVFYIFKKCRELFVLSHERLSSNFKKFIMYGFMVPIEKYGDLANPALSCLITNNFDEIVDQFIEVNRGGHAYIKENMSRITTTQSPKDILFYNMIASTMDHNEIGEYQYPEGPFTGTNCMRLRGSITRYPGSGYENTPYRGITEENKEHKTNTVEITIPNKEDFDYAVAEAKTSSKVYDLSDAPALKDLEEFTDTTDPYRYDFDGVLISKLKVHRIYQILQENNLDTREDSLLYAITYNSILTEEALEKIKNAIKDRRK